jgi:hypothetical protein
MAVVPRLAQYDWRRTIQWVDQNGNEIERGRLRGLLGRAHPDARLLRTLEARQNPDGGFPSGLVQGRPSSIDTTALVLRWLQDLWMMTSPQAQRLMTDLLTAQRPDGSWDEPLGLLRFGLSPRLLPGDPRAQALCTALGAYSLVLLGQRADHTVARAMAYLRPRQAAGGRFLGFLRTTWLAAAVFRLVEGPGSQAASRALEALAAVPEDRWQPGALAGMLAALAVMDVPAHAPIASHGLNRLLRLADDDGSWPSEDGDFFRSEVTLWGLRALLAYGQVSRAGDPTVPSPAEERSERPGGSRQRTDEPGGQP